MISFQKKGQLLKNDQFSKNGQIKKMVSFSQKMANFKINSQFLQKETRVYAKIGRSFNPLKKTKFSVKRVKSVLKKQLSFEQKVTGVQTKSSRKESGGKSR